MTTEHLIYAASVKQIAGLVAERDALMTVVAAKQAQVDALLGERAALQEQARGLKITLESARRTIDAWQRAFMEASAELARLRAEIDEIRTENTDPFDLACLDSGARISQP
jgi:chromosome segregation ATPase